MKTFLTFSFYFNSSDENNIMHRDIKGSNIFLKAIDPKHPEKIVLKLGDFGCSIKFKDIIGSSPAKATGFMGTFRNWFFFSFLKCKTKSVLLTFVYFIIAFMAPEVMTRLVLYNFDFFYNYIIKSLNNSIFKKVEAQLMQVIQFQPIYGA